MKVLSDVQPAAFRIVPKLAPTITAAEQRAERFRVRTESVSTSACWSMSFIHLAKLILDTAA